jgi:oxygen-independent coproporphyrinogen III oxidase
MFRIYIHIPFCRTRCPYCDFVSQAIPGAVPEEYVQTLCGEIEAFEGPSAAESVFYGGGTPSLLSTDQAERILTALHRRFRLDAPEITIEANPDDVTAALVGDWARLGINRVSLGVQHFDDAILRYLGRRHDADGARRACAQVAEHFTNWNLDLIFGAPPVDRWAYTLAEAVSWRPTHIAAYGLTYEPGTRFEQRTNDAVDDEQWLALYQTAESMLSEYVHYEVSNFALPGFESRHNLGYWRNEAYAGFGTGAYSFVDGVRARNLVDTAAYLLQPGFKGEALMLSDAEARVETLIQHFRLKEGLPKESYRKRFGRAVEDDFGPQIALLKQRGLLEETDDRIFPTQEGFYLNNEIGLALVEV